MRKGYCVSRDLLDDIRTIALSVDEVDTFGRCCKSGTFFAGR